MVVIMLHLPCSFLRVLANPSVVTERLTVPDPSTREGSMFPFFGYIDIKPRTAASFPMAWEAETLQELGFRS